jgi:GMP synthase-like glutamine amidotransferase
VAFEGPGALAAIMAKRGYMLRSHLVPTEGVPAQADEFLIVMGGPMSVNDPDRWIQQEMDLIRRTVHAGIPVLGICLGSQLLARALDAHVYAGRGLELGMTPVHLTADGRRDPVFSALPEKFEVFEWHGEVFDLPTGAVALAASELCALQAFRVGVKAYGLLFHLEIERAGIRALCRECPGDLHRAKLDAESIIRAAESHLPRLHNWADRLIAHLAQ